MPSPFAGIYSSGWFERDYAEMRVIIDESEPMGDMVRIAVTQRIFGVTGQPTATTLFVKRSVWEELMRVRRQYIEDSDHAG